MAKATKRVEPRVKRNVLYKVLSRVGKVLRWLEKVRKSWVKAERGMEMILLERMARG